MKKRSFYKITPLNQNKDNTSSNLELVEYPDEDLYEDGELSDNEYLQDVAISEVEYKILQLWRSNKIVIARWEESDEI